MGFVYLLMAVDIEGNESHKIGTTKNSPNKRLKQLQTGNPNKIEILHIYESDNYKLVEQWMHGRYFLDKTDAKNEWFNLNNQAILEFIDNCKKADSTMSFMLKENPFFKKK